MYKEILVEQKLRRRKKRSIVYLYTSEISVLETNKEANNFQTNIVTESIMGQNIMRTKLVPGPSPYSFNVLVKIIICLVGCIGA